MNSLKRKLVDFAEVRTGSSQQVQLLFWPHGLIYKLMMTVTVVVTERLR